MSKLVRDKIPEIMESKGDTPSFHIASQDDLVRALDAKLNEEIAELRAATDPSDRAEEIADIIEVLLALANQDGYDSRQIEEIRQKKFEKRGGFERGVILEKW